MIRKLAISWLIHGKGFGYLLVFVGIATARVKQWWLWRRIEREARANRETR